MSEPHPLEGCWAKLRWAKVNVDALQDEVAAYFGGKTNPNALRVHLDAEATKGLPDEVRKPPWHWPLMIGDIVHSFRSSLNYLTWELAHLELRRRGKTRKPSRSTQFPIVRDPNRWTEVAAARLADVGDREQAIIEGFQPYNAEDPADIDDHPLTWLNRLSNRDKHQTLALTLLKGGVMDEELEEVLTGWAFIVGSHVRYATILDPDGNEKAKYNVKTTFEIAL
jgi:hypothetical protein